MICVASPVRSSPEAASTTGDFLAGPDHLLDLFERDVTTLLRVVELRIRVPF